MLDVSRLVSCSGSMRAAELNPRTKEPKSMDAILGKYCYSDVKLRKISMQKRVLWDVEKLEKVVSTHIRDEIQYRHKIRVQMK